MPAKSENQRAAFGMALAARRGKLDPKLLRGAARHLYADNTLSESQLSEFAAKREIERGTQLIKKREYTRR